MRILFLFAIVLIACQSENKATETPHVFADYFVRYLQTERQLKAYATFHEGDTFELARPLTFPKGVQFQNKPMEARPLSTNTVRYTYNGTDASAGNKFVFNYEDLNGVPQTYTLQMPPVEDFSVQDGATKQGITLQWKGAPFQANENLILLFSNAKNEAFSVELKGVADKKTIAIPAAQLIGLTPGKHSLYLVKQQTTVVKQGNTDITAQVEFYTKTIEIQIGR